MCSFNRVKYNLFMDYLRDHYNPSDLVDKLDMPMEDLLQYIEDYILFNLDVFTDDLIKIGIQVPEDMDYDD